MKKKKKKPKKKNKKDWKTKKKGKEKRKEKQENDKKNRIIVTGGSYGNEVAVTTTESISLDKEHFPIEGPELNIARKHHAQVRMKD
jgi:UDP-N-acetylglucosamine:LPS N-acetylglucosamine transferase